MSWTSDELSTALFGDDSKLKPWLKPGNYPNLQSDTPTPFNIFKYWDWHNFQSFEDVPTLDGFEFEGPFAFKDPNKMHLNWSCFVPNMQNVDHAWCLNCFVETLYVNACSLKSRFDIIIISLLH